MSGFPGCNPFGEQPHVGRTQEEAMGQPAVARYVVGFLFDLEGVLLIRKARPAWQRGRLNGVGGKIETGETPVDAMRREFSEEAGAQIEGWEHFATLMGIDTPTQRPGAPPGMFEIWYYRAEGWIVAPAGGDEPCAWYLLQGVGNRGDLIPSLRWLIPLATGPKHNWPFLISEHA